MYERGTVLALVLAGRGGELATHITVRLTTTWLQTTPSTCTVGNASLLTVSGSGGAGIAFNAVLQNP